MQRRSVSMARRLLLLPLLAVALVGVAKGQGTTEKKVEIVKYPVPGSEDAVAEVKTEEARRVLDDFYHSGALEDLHQAAVKNDPAANDRLIADQVVWVAERLGVGESLTKAQVLADFGSGHLHMNSHTHDHVRLVAFGTNVVIATGRSTSVLHYGGKVDKGPRVFAEVWMKQDDGHWQMVEHVQADSPNGTTRGFE
jgi:hypothetical protein